MLFSLTFAALETLAFAFGMMFGVLFIVGIVAAAWIIIPLIFGV